MCGKYREYGIELDIRENLMNCCMSNGKGEIRRVIFIVTFNFI